MAVTPGEEDLSLQQRYGAERRGLSDDWKEWLHNTYAAHGSLGPEALDDRAVETIMDRGQRACDLVAADILSTIGGTVVALISHGEWGTRVLLDGKESSGSGFVSIGQEQLAVEVADAVHEEVMDDRRGGRSASATTPGSTQSWSTARHPGCAA